nr:alpha-1,2-fucosyltransferase [uncultured Butyrivibrio sp.]
MKKRPKVHLYIRGNCGNQFFQYAFARYIQEKTDAELIINYSKARGKAIFKESDNLLQDYETVPYKYESNMGWGGFMFRLFKLFRYVFGLTSMKKRTYRFLLRCAKILPPLGIYYFDAAYYPFPIYKKKNIYVYGYFESPRYFEEIDEKIKKELTPRNAALEQNKDLLDVINNSESVCVTIKRRDITDPVYQYDISYFYRAIEYLKKELDNPVFVVFSDDVEWCRNNIKVDANLMFETPNNPIWEKIRLMSSCKHFIIHNSTFSWWAQHLSKNKMKKVIAPSKWMQRDDQPIDIYEKGWIYLTPEGEFVEEHD